MKTEELKNTGLLKFFDELSEEQQRVMTLRYGLDGNPPMFYADIVQKMGVSGERVRKLETEAIYELEKKKARAEIEEHTTSLETEECSAIDIASVKTALEVLEQFPEIETTNELKETLEAIVDSLPPVYLRLRILNLSIDVLGLSIRARNCLQCAGVRTLAETAEKSTEQVLRIRDCGPQTTEEIEAMLNRWNLTFGMSKKKMVENLAFDKDLYAETVANFKVRCGYLSGQKEEDARHAISAMAEILNDTAE